MAERYQRLPFGAERRPGTPVPVATRHNAHELHRPAQGVVTRDGTTLVIRFSRKHIPFINAVKEIPGYRWVPTDPDHPTVAGHWAVHIGYIRQVRALATRHGWHLSPAVTGLPDMDPREVPMLVTVEGEQLLIDGPWRADVAKILTAGDGRLDRNGLWRLPLEHCVDVVLDMRKVARVRFVGNPTELTDRIDYATYMLALSRQLDPTDGWRLAPTITREPRTFQHPGIEYGWRAPRTFNWATMGSGKSLVALATMEQLDWTTTSEGREWALDFLRSTVRPGAAIVEPSTVSPFPLLIICPAGLKTNWYREIQAALPHRRAWICDGKTPRIPLQQPDAYICNYDILGLGDSDGRPKQRSWIAYFVDLIQRGQLNSYIVDEGHRCANGKAQRTVAAIEAADALPAGAPRMLLTGTPLRNGRRDELLPQLQVIGRGGEFGDKKQLTADRHLARRLRTVCAWRPHPKAVLEALGVMKPDGTAEPIWQTVVVDGDPKVMAEYRKAESSFMDWLRDTARAKAIELGTDPESAAVAAAMKAGSAEQLMLVNALCRLAGQAKIPAAKEWVRDFETTGEKLLVFAENIDMMEAVAGERIPMIRGGVKHAERTKLVDRFQDEAWIPEADRLQTLVLQVVAAGEGITLTKAYQHLYTQITWAPGAMDQCAARCIVAGQTIQTDRGAVLIENVVVGDRVLTHLGNWKPVEATSFHSVDSYVEIECVRHMDRLRCTPDHRLWVKSQVTGEVGWKRADQVDEADLLALPRPCGDGVASVPTAPKPSRACLGCGELRKIVTHGLCNRCRLAWRRPGRPNRKRPDRAYPTDYVLTLGNQIAPGPIKVTDELLWAFGRWLGDGWLAKRDADGRYHNVGLCGHINERPAVERALQVIAAAVGLEITTQTFMRDNKCELTISSVELAQLFASWFFASPPAHKTKDSTGGKGSQGVVKRLAPWMVDLSDQQAAALLHGLISSDGHWRPRDGGSQFSSTSPHLAHQVTWLAAKVGFDPSLRPAPYREWGSDPRPTSGGIRSKRRKYEVAWQRREPLRMRHDLRLSDPSHVWSPVVASRTVTKSATVHELTVKDDRSFVVGQVAVHNSAWRMNDPHNVIGHVLVCADTIDEDRMTVQAFKRQAMSLVTDGDQLSAVAAESTYGEVFGRLLGRALGMKDPK